jgi:hypothetical protein
MRNSNTNSNNSDRPPRGYPSRQDPRQQLRQKNKNTQSKRSSIYPPVYNTPVYMYYPYKKENNSNNNSNNSWKKIPNLRLPSLLEINFPMGEPVPLPPGGKLISKGGNLPQVYRTNNGKGCICHPPQTWIQRFNKNLQEWKIAKTNLQALNGYKRNNKAPPIGIPNEDVFLRDDGKVCVCKAWSQTSKSVGQQIITVLAGRPPSRSRKSTPLDRKFKATAEQRRQRNARNARKMLI